MWGSRCLCCPRSGWCRCGGEGRGNGEPRRARCEPLIAASRRTIVSRVFVVLGVFVVLPAYGSAGESPELCRGGSHPMLYSRAGPVAAGRRPPVLLAGAGAGGDFGGQARRFHQACGERRVVLVVPCTLTSANRMT